MLPRYRTRFSKRQFTQPQLLAVLCLMRYEDWTFREAEVRLSEHRELRQTLGLMSVPDFTTLYRFLKRLDDRTIEGMAGDKDLELTGGELTIQVGSHEDYSHVDLSVKFRDVSGSQFGDPKGWLGNSVRKDGNGKYRLHAHVTAGDVDLKS